MISHLGQVLNSIFHFDLNEKRTGVKVIGIEAKSLEELHGMAILFGEGFNSFNINGQKVEAVYSQGFGRITDLESALLVVTCARKLNY